MKNSFMIKGNLRSLILILVPMTGLAISGCNPAENNTESEHIKGSSSTHSTDLTNQNKYSSGYTSDKPEGEHSLIMGEKALLNYINNAIDSQIEDFMTHDFYYNNDDNIDDEFAVEFVEDAAAEPASEPASEASYSQTNLIEQGVDEADFVKQNTNYIFVYGDKDGRKAIRIYKKTDFDQLSIEDRTGIQNNTGIQQSNNALQSNVNPTNTNSQNLDTQQLPTAVSHISIYPDKEVEGIYLTKNHLITLNLAGISENPYGERSNSSIDIEGYDIADINAPKPILSIRLNGKYKQSRKINDELYVITENSIDLSNDLNCDSESYYRKIVDKLASTPESAIQYCQDKYRLTQQQLNRRMPLGSDGKPIDPGQCYVPRTNQQNRSVITNYNDLTLINRINLKSGDLQTICVASSANGFYMSNAAMYFANNEYYQPSNEQQSTGNEAEMVMVEYTPPVQKTTLHKFAIRDKANKGLVYVGSGQVAGIINEEVPSFSMNEYQGVLRIATSAERYDGIENMLHTLKESDTKLELVTLATLPNEQNPKPIGKPQERIKGVRFMGDQGYIVTFKNTDPLYKIDLSNPANPIMKGELEMPGYSAYLHKINDNYVMGIGYTVNQSLRPDGIQITLFDVTDMPKIVSQDTVAIHDQDFQPYFDLMIDEDSKALSTVMDGGVYKVTLPYLLEISETNNYYYKAKAVEYEIDPKTAIFINRYRRDGQKLDANHDGVRFRALIDGDKLYYATNDGMINKYLWGKP